jgi:hypothetical protein
MRDPLDDIQRPEEAKKHFLKYLREDVFQLNFYRLHMLYFISVIGIFSVIVYGEGLANGSTDINGTKLRYIDALFLCCSAMTTTGLNTVNLGSMTGFQQAMLCVLLLIGNVVFVSSFVVVIRRHYFRVKLADIVQHSKSGRGILQDIEQEEQRQSREPGQTQWKKIVSTGQSSGRAAADKLRKRLTCKRFWTWTRRKCSWKPADTHISRIFTLST